MKQYQVPKYCFLGFMDQHNTKFLIWQRPCPALRAFDPETVSQTVSKSSLTHPHGAGALLPAPRFGRGDHHIARNQGRRPPRIGSHCKFCNVTGPSLGTAIWLGLVLRFEVLQIWLG